MKRIQTDNFKKKAADDRWTKHPDAPQPGSLITDPNAPADTPEEIKKKWKKKKRVSRPGVRTETEDALKGSL